ncbi:tetratricopeptide repeat protein [Hymenobacter sp. BT683]|uniref:Tetratricopeptide repeat protein n=1 Tax=Hymenobacter jeongseonensis TaxID=2791027 RepID=A0ABS0IC57_9BACT|nr:tetratricopeptide repeat protein [Hymenobacter jeongseonensis]MBF9235938.1 tetratricopeptide repeat protein [Hymenobacter jeongseonensis]
MRPHFLVVAASFLLALPAQAQQPDKAWAPVSGTALANDYARRGEHDKVVFLLEKLPAAEQTSPTVFPVYLASLQALKRHKDAEKLAKKAMKQHAEDATLGVALGGVYAAAGDAPAAEKQWQKVLSQLVPSQVQPVAAEFSRRELPQWAERTYLRGRALAKNDTEYAPQLIQLYTQSQNQPQVLAETLRLIALDEKQLPFVRNMLQNALREEKDFDALERLLLTATQEHPDQATYSELLLWLQMQRRDFAGALVQARALDRRGRGEGVRVMELAAIAQQNKDYESAIEGFGYVAREYRNGPYGNVARQRLLQAREAQVRETYPVDLTKVRALVTDYEQLLTEQGRTPDTAPVLRNLANLHAFQLNDRAKAMTLLQEVIDMPRASNDVVDEAKVTLGDLYLLKGEPWEATLLYSQVEKSHKDSPLGYEAKLRNARLSYYAGDFKLAQSHLDILKEATTREIANDAMQLSLLIQDNTVEDTLGLGLRAYAAVEQLVFQNKLKEAIAGLDVLLEKFPGHSLADDTYYLKAQLQRRTGDFTAATATLERITNNPKYDVLSDDALFLLARIQEEDMKDKGKAQELYNQVITKYPGSIYVAEARKRFRKLRGDGV